MPSRKVRGLKYLKSKRERTRRGQDSPEGGSHAPEQTVEDTRPWAERKPWNDTRKNPKTPESL